MVKEWVGIRITLYFVLSLSRSGAADFRADNSNQKNRRLLAYCNGRLPLVSLLARGWEFGGSRFGPTPKARARWGQGVFEQLFLRTIESCVQAGLVDGQKRHLDGSLINADPSNDSVVSSSPELIKALKQAYGVQERKLEGQPRGPPLTNPCARPNSAAPTRTPRWCAMANTGDRVTRARATTPPVRWTINAA